MSELTKLLIAMGDDLPSDTEQQDDSGHCFHGYPSDTCYQCAHPQQAQTPQCSHGAAYDTDCKDCGRDMAGGKWVMASAMPQCSHGVHLDSVCDQCETNAKLRGWFQYPATIYPTPDLPRQMPDLVTPSKADRMMRALKDVCGG